MQPDQAQNRRLGWRLEIALFSVGGALGLSLLLQRHWAGFPYWFPFLVAGVGSAWVGGRVSGWTAVILSTLGVDFFFQRPYYSLAIDSDELPYFIVFAVSMIAGNWFGAWRKNTELALAHKRQELESRVQAGRVELEKVSEELRSELSSRELAEQERRIAELRWKAVFENAVVGVALADGGGRILVANQRYGELAQEGAGASLVGLVDEAQRPGLQAQLAELHQGRRPPLQLELPRGATRWLRVHVAAVPGTADFPSFLIAFCEDISDRHLAERALGEARAELAHASRLTTIGELTASIAHELNQPLSAIVTNGNACLRWLSGDSPKLEEARNSANWIMRDARRASDVIARIRALTRKSEPEWKPLDFNELVRDSLELVRNELERRRIEVLTRLDPALPPLRGERIQLQQVFLNLVLNAIEAMAAVADRPRRLEISTAAEAGAVPGVMGEVRDSGSGVAEENLDKLFGAFFTTKPEGTGLGLWISRSIIENHSGRLVATANPDHGMCFRIHLPCEPQPEPAPAAIAGEDFRP